MQKTYIFDFDGTLVDSMAPAVEMVLSLLDEYGIEYESGIVAQEFIKGYTYRDNVVRHSMVAVAE